MKRLLLITITLVALNLTALSQAFQNAGATGDQFLKIGVGAKAMGMGGAFGSLAGDASSLAWNPAGIGTIQTIQLSVDHTPWVAGINHDFVGLVVPIADNVNLGFHTIFASSGPIEITTIDQPEGTGSNYDVADVAVGLTSSVRLTTQLTFAVTVKYVQERIYDVQSGGVASDFGAWYATNFRSLTVGFSVMNLGFDEAFTGHSLEVQYSPPGTSESPINSELQAEPYSLPLMFRASGSFDFFEMFASPLPEHKLTAAVDFLQNADTPERLMIGAEYTWRDMLSLRSGYAINSDELSWNVGGGATIDASGFVLEVDYAVSSLGRFGLGQRFGITMSY